MSKPKQIYTLVLSGPTDALDQFIAQHYPGCETHLLSYEALHESGSWGKVLFMRRAKGEALVIASDQSLPGGRIPNQMLSAGLAARCRNVVFIGGPDNIQTFTRLALLRRIPRLILCAFVDAIVITSSFIVFQALRLWLRKPAKTRSDKPTDIEVAHLFPLALSALGPGGEMSYLEGTLTGLAEAGARAEAISSLPMPTATFPVHIVPSEQRYTLLREARALLYNLRFYRQAKKLLRQRRPRMLYQRHHAFVVSGALLSRALGIPLVLEYQNSELWRVNNWDPCHFCGLLKMAEDLSLRSAHGYAVLSNVLRDELLARGIGKDKIAVNPAAADVHRFYPGCGGAEARERLGFAPEDIVVTFLGSFSYYHGITVLQASIATLLRRRLQRDHAPKLKFLLIGDGILRLAMKQELDALEGSETVIFAGSVTHDKVPGLLDASDILVSPHVPLEDGSAFFGSPTKLFEYMAAGKAIVASNLYQLAEVLEHGKTALMVSPGNDAELTEAIELLARDPELRHSLGSNARDTVLERHTWRHNGVRALSFARAYQQGISADAGIEAPGSLRNLP